MSITVGRRIIYNKLNGNIIVDLGEMRGDIFPRESLNESDIGLIDLDYGQFTKEFARMESVKVNIETKELEFVLKPKNQTPEEQIEELENQLLIAEGVI